MDPLTPTVHKQIVFVLILLGHACGLVVLLTVVTLGIARGWTPGLQWVLLAALATWAAASIRHLSGAYRLSLPR